MKIKGTDLLVLAVLVLTALTIVLAHQNRLLVTSLQSERELAARPAPGSYTGLFTASTLDAQEVVIGEMDRAGRQVLFFFNTSCDYCRASIPAWKELAARVGSVGNEAFGVSLDSVSQTREYATEHMLTYPVVHFDTRRTRSIYRVRAVPQVVILDSSGVVLYSRIGVLHRRTAAFDSVFLAAVDSVRLATQN